MTSEMCNFVWNDICKSSVNYYRNISTAPQQFSTQEIAPFRPLFPKFSTIAKIYLYGVWGIMLETNYR